MKNILVGQTITRAEQLVCSEAISLEIITVDCLQILAGSHFEFIGILREQNKNKFTTSTKRRNENNITERK